jgi:aminomethyltransferase
LKVHLHDVSPIALTTMMDGLIISHFFFPTEGAKIFKPSSDEFLGTITSGIPSPTLGQNIAMGYVKSGSHKKGTELEVDVRNKRRKAVVTPMPFIKPRYWRG